MDVRAIARTLLLILLSTLVFGGPMVQAEEATEKVVLLLPETVQVRGSAMILGEIAKVSGPPGLASQVAAVNAGAAPRAGSSRRLTKGQIEVRLRQAGLDLNKVEFQGAETIQVFGLAAGTPPQGATSSTTTSSPVPSYEVVVARRELARGEILTANDLSLEEREFRNAQPDPRRLEDFVGLRTTRHVLPGTILNHLNAEAVPVIERGAKVTIIVRTAGLAVTAPGVARASGAVGDVIPVENSLSKQVVYGEILDSATVEVRIGG